MANKIKLGITGRINAYFFYQMYIDSLKESVCNRNVIDWCMKAGVITNSYECPVCKESMQLKQRKDLSDKWEWSCRKDRKEDGHRKSRTVRKGTCFDNSNLSMTQILLLIWYWLNKYSHQTVRNEIDCSNSTVCDWYGFCREVCIEVCIKTSEKIGGKGRVVEFEESKFGKRKQKAKDSKQQAEEQGKWVYVGIERDTDKYFFIVKPTRSKESLYHMLHDWIVPGTTIITDCWSVHDCLEDEDFQLLKDLNSITFKSLEIGGLDNAGGGGCSFMKRNMKGLSKYKDQYDGHLAEYMWKRRNKSEIQQEFVSFLEAIKIVYPPQAADNV